MKFTKLQGAGNDFILVETSDTSRNWSLIATIICDRHFGVGADGLLLLLPSDVADFRMREFNPDGSEAEACGNGLRCLAKYVMKTKLADTTTPEISIETIAGTRKARLHYEGDKGGEAVGIQVSMGQPELGAKDIPVAIETGKGDVVDIKSMKSYSITIGGKGLLLNFVSMGNPHAIHFGQQPVSEFPLSRLGPEIEHHKLFPERVNFEVARVISRQQIEARVWERGVGETLACGSGACAVAVAAQLHGYIDNKVAIKLPGGILDVEWDGAGEVLLGGPAEIVFTGEWPHEGGLSG
jgi:diaminopimelate epimerase